MESQPSYYSGSSGGIHLSLLNVMRIYADNVVCVAASRAWSLAVRRSKDGSAAIWDLNHGMYVRLIWHEEGGESMMVNLVANNESIVTASAVDVWMILMTVT